MLEPLFQNAAGLDARVCGVAIRITTPAAPALPAVLSLDGTSRPAHRFVPPEPPPTPGVNPASKSWIGPSSLTTPPPPPPLPAFLLWPPSPPLAWNSALVVPRRSIVGAETTMPPPEPAPDCAATPAVGGVHDVRDHGRPGIVDDGRVEGTRARGVADAVVTVGADGAVADDRVVGQQQDLAAAGGLAARDGSAWCARLGDRAVLLRVGVGRLRVRVAARAGRAGAAGATVAAAAVAGRRRAEVHRGSAGLRLRGLGSVAVDECRG